MISKRQRYNILRHINWDYSIPVKELDDLVTGARNSAGHYTRLALLKKMLGSLPWLTIIKLFPLDYLKENLTEDFVSGLWPESLKNKYIYVYQKLRDLV
ncbi:MAG: hypothetical protein JXA66_07945 [Oligoflexia bacterium]|nr:hypothetical protein [Oligoflexia bacterium]